MEKSHKLVLKHFIASLIISVVLSSSAYVGDPCQYNSECRNLGSGGFCERSTGICQCDSKYSTESEDLTKCLLLVNHLGGFCEERAQCKSGLPGQFSDCVNETNNSTGNQNNQKVCKCLAEAINEAGQNVCWKKLTYIGEKCSRPIQCQVNIGATAECYSSKCDCRSNGVPLDENRKCLPRVNLIGGECIHDRQCTWGTPGAYSHCVNIGSSSEGIKICNCTEAAINERGSHLCRKKAEFIGEPCSESIQCRANLGSLSTCTSFRCLCPSNGVPVDDNRRCLPRINRLGSPCEKDVQCQWGVPGRWSECVAGQTEMQMKCRCTPEAFNELGSHLCQRKSVAVGDDCENDVQCKVPLGETAFCGRDKKCGCTVNVGIPSEDYQSCLPIVNLLGGRCSEDRQCQLGLPGIHSECNGNGNGENIIKRCSCKSTALNALGRHQCLKKAEQIGEECTIDEQCRTQLGELTSCRSRVCSCLTSRAVPSYDYERCLPIVNQLWRSCQEDIQCQFGEPGAFSECDGGDINAGRNRTCVCREDSVNECPSNKCLKKAEMIGDECETDKQCKANLGEKTECQNGKCACKSAYHLLPSSENCTGDCLT